MLDLKDVKAGDYLVTTDSEIVLVQRLDTENGTHNHLLHYDGTQSICFNGFLTKCTKWTPKEGEYCCFFSNNADSFRVARFRQQAWGKGREGQYKDMQGRYSDRIAPYGFPIEVILGRGLGYGNIEDENQQGIY